MLWQSIKSPRRGVSNRQPQHMILWRTDVSSTKNIYEPRHEKTYVLHMRKQRRRSAAKLISAFVFATWIVQ